MHIKQIIIQGFKSYKSQTVIDPFSPKHNVIVGRNGSGKSNFFAAIRFVLGDAYTQMGREERQALLHEGSGSAVMTAYVEVIFDNADRRFPNGLDEMILRRTIGQKKDEYSLDRKNATKTDVLNILESAGFSRSNPYYIVPQGRVTALTNMKDPERLNLLKEVAGTHVYETKRQESKRMIEDSDNRRNKINELLQVIGDRLGELEEEKEELRGFQEKDREKRCLEYTIYCRDQKAVQDKLDELDDLRQDGAGRSESNRELFLEGERALSTIDDRIKELKQQIDFLSIDKKQYDEERKSVAREKAQIELDVQSMTDGQAAAQQAKTRHDADLRDVQSQIQERETELAGLLPQYNSQKDREVAAKARLDEADGQRQRLYSKQGRQAQFKNKRDRDNWLKAQIDEVNVALATRKAVAMETAETIVELQREISEMDSDVSALRSRIENRGDESQNMSTTIQQAKDERDRLTDQRRELYRQNDKLESIIANAQQELQKAERGLSHMMDRNTSQGIAAVRRIARQHNISGVYGTLAELFSISGDGYKTATEVTAGPSLFHYVVDTDETATKVLEILQREKAGRVTFMPLNRLRPRPINMPKSNEVLPLITKLEYEEQYEPAMQQVFGKTLVCTNLQIAGQYARSHGVTAITPDGDRADKKGALTGGYVDTSRSRLDAVQNLLKWRSDLDKHTDNKLSTRNEIEALDQQITRAVSNVQKAEQKRQQTENNYGPLLQELRAKSNDAQSKRDQLDKLEGARAKADANVQQLGHSSSDYQTEMASDFKKALTDNEERQLQTLAGQVQDLRKEVNELSSARSELEARKTTIEVELRENLRLRLDQLRAEDLELSTGSGGGSRDTRLSERQRELKRIDKALAAFVKKLQAAETSIEQSQQELTTSEQQRTRQQNEQNELAVQMHRQQKAVEKSASRRALYTNQAQDVASKIRNLGVLPDASFNPPYTTMKYDQALKRFHKVQEELKKYGHVNKKAFEQFNQFTKQRADLEKRREELDNSLSSITELIETLDLRKDEAIERTFRQVSREFAQIFEKLVPAGKGSLKIQRRSDRQAEEEDESGDDEDRRRKKGSVESYTGVSIQVSFNSKHDEQQKIQQLSGGQKSLCALALVFAIQASDPAPFYLFDEIDANLDAQYRTAVAQMLSESATQGQFICTTFRPEMLHVADKCYGVSYENKTSEIDVVSREDALKFVEGQISGN